MTYPPQFSSTIQYANRYDLDEIDVFLEGDSTNPMFFNVSGLPSKLSLGKHYFYLNILNDTNQDYQLRATSRILFEFKSSNNVVLKSDVLNINQQNGVVTCFVELLGDPLRTYKSIADGEGTLTIAGSLKNKPNRGQIIPQKFRNAINYRCIFPIDIRKNLTNSNSPIITNSEHKTSTLKGQFSFAKAGISADRNADKGMNYNAAGNPDIPGGGSGTT